MLSTNLSELISAGKLVLGVDVCIDENVVMCYPDDQSEKDGISKPTIVGDGSVIRSGTIVYQGAEIGKKCHIGHNGIIRGEVIIGDNSVLSHNIVVEYGTHLGKWVRISPHTHLTGWVVVEDRVFLGAGVITINDKNLIWRRDGVLLDPPKVRFGARVGSGTILMPGITVGRLSLVGAGSVVTRDIPEFSVAFGNPARIVREADPLLVQPNGPEEYVEA